VEQKREMNAAHHGKYEHGFTLIEVLIAVTVLSIGVGATMRVFGAAGRTTLSAQAQHVAVQHGQAELERLGTLAYGELALTGNPMQSSDPLHPGYKVSGTSFAVRAGLSEPLVLVAGAGATPKVEPGPQTFAVGTAGGTITGKLYRYVTWRDETCPLSLCEGGENTKRLTVAVVVDAAYRSSTRPPVWVSTIVVDPATAPPGSQAPPGAAPGSGDPVTAQSFYLYDTPCGSATRQAQTGSHPTRNTAAGGDAAEDNSTCEHPSPDKQPDLMAPSAPPGDPNTPLFDYSDDLVGTYDGGLATARAGSECVHSYAAEDAGDAQGPSKWSVHAWSTGALPQLFHLDKQVTLSLFTATVGGMSSAGRLCATLVDRVTEGGMPSDRVIGTVTYDLASWPRDARRVTFTFSLPQSEDIATGHRLMLVLHARAESTHDLLLLYDHPLYPSLLEVATTTPL
jgi:prepilin-type N-terminal cleavage/methylation domain-containing protein